MPTFSALFGEPFMPLDPMVYADMLGERIAEGKTRVYLVNTGWVEGSYGVGHRIPLVYNRINVNAALDGSLEDAEFIHDEVFNLDIPTTCPGVPDDVMVPWKWLGQQGRVRRHGQEARRHVPGELREEVRPPAREREERRPARLRPHVISKRKGAPCTHLHGAPSSPATSPLRLQGILPSTVVPLRSTKRSTGECPGA